MLTNKLFDLLDMRLPWLLVALMFCAGAAGGWYINGLRWEAKYAALEKTHAEAAAAQADAIVEALEKVRALERQGDELAAQVIALDAARVKLAKEKEDAIRKTSTGRRCLDAGLVRLLNEPVGPGAGSRPAPASGSPSVADTAFASDTDIALWARDARDAHDACRARINALRTFYGMEPE